MAKVMFKRIENSANINSVPFKDGNFIVTKDGKSYVDYTNTRVPTSGTTDSSMSDSSRNAVENRVIKNYIDTNCRKEGKVLWTNNLWTANFSAQTINLFYSLDNYDCYEIIFKQSTSVSRLMSTGLIPVGNGTILNYTVAYPKYRPTETGIGGSTIAFEDCKSVTAIGSTSVDNSSIIPVYVIGYKTNTFD